MIKTKKMNGKDLTPEQLQGLDAGLTQGGNTSVINPPKIKKPSVPSGEIKKPSVPSGEIKKDSAPVNAGSRPDGPKAGSRPEKKQGSRPEKKAPKYNPYGTGTANPSNMSGSTGP